jgi:cytoskeletal protein CcmA (bactofilin family)
MAGPGLPFALDSERPAEAGPDDVSGIDERSPMLGKKSAETLDGQSRDAGGRDATRTTLLSVIGANAKIEGKFEIAESIQIECAVGGELSVGGRLVIGEKGVVNANVQTVDAIIMGQYEGNMAATGNVEIAATGRVSGNLHTDSLVIAKGGVFNGNVTKVGAEEVRPEDGEKSQGAVYLLDDKRAGQQR